ncbi:MAG: HEAT repeat domain-containing protein, partial [Victivallales bacterium]|nr:HEAT repeat domain-containing protein [Victivallales bacterium]
KKEKAIFPKNMLWRDLANSAAKCPEPMLEELASSPDTTNRANAAKIFAIKSPAPDSNKTLSKNLDDPEDIVRAMLAQGLASRSSGGITMLEKLARSASIQIRSATASATSSPERLGMHLKFMADKDPEIRRIAAAALAGYKDPSVHAPLINAFGDPCKPVRSAAEDSLIHLKISPEVLDRIAAASLAKSPDDLSAVRVIGALGDKRYSTKITQMLKSAEEDEMIIRSATALGLLEHAPAADIVASKASSKNPDVRQAVAVSLGKIKQKSTFDTLKKLAEDADTNVAGAAIRSMGWIADPYFTDSLMKAAKNVKTSPSLRSFACWSLARINQPSKEQISLMKRNIMEKIIPVPMAGPEFDSDYARIAATMALVEFSRKDDHARETAIEVLEKLRLPQERQGMFFMSSLTLQEYARQAEHYLQGKTPDKMPLPTTSPSLTVEKYVKH